MTLPQCGRCLNGQLLHRQATSGALRRAGRAGADGAGAGGAAPMSLTKEQAAAALAQLQCLAESQPDVAVTHDLADGVQLRVTYSPPRDRRGRIDLSRVDLPSLLWHTDIAIGGAIVAPWDNYIPDEHALYLLEGGNYEELCERRRAEGAAAVAHLTRRMKVLDA